MPYQADARVPADLAAAVAAACESVGGLGSGESGSDARPPDGPGSAAVVNWSSAAAGIASAPARPESEQGSSGLKAPATEAESEGVEQCEERLKCWN